jgi:hypothetical protein
MRVQVLAKIEYRVSEVMESQRKSLSGIKKSKSHATLVRSIRHLDAIKLACTATHAHSTHSRAHVCFGRCAYPWPTARSTA